MDDGSPDNCGRICDEYALKDNRVYVIRKENGGLSDARNAGIDWVFEHSNSEWLTFIDSDDWIHPEYLNFLLSAAISSNVDVSICRYEVKMNYRNMALLIIRLLYTIQRICLLTIGLTWWLHGENYTGR